MSTGTRDLGTRTRGLETTLSAMWNKAKSGVQHGARPPAAVEITPEGVLAAALPGKNQPPVYAFAPLRPGALVPGIGEPNLRAPGAVADAMRAVLDDVSPRTRAVTLVVPDTSVRVFVLDFDSLPATPPRLCRCCASGCGRWFPSTWNTRA